MIIDLSKIEFTNDIFSTLLPDDNMLVLNKIDEGFLVEGYEEECTIKVINIEVVTPDGDTIQCPCVVGLGNDLLKIDTKYTEYEGAVLTPENMAFCTIEVYE